MARRRPRSIRFLVTVVAAVCLAAAPRGAAQDRGDGAADFRYSPIDLEVVDAAVTVAIALKAGERPPVVVVYDPTVATAVTTAFEDAFGRTQAVFIERMQVAFGARELDAAAVAGPAFRDFRAEFQARNPLMPVSPGLAQTWARGFDADPVRERIAALLRLVARDRLIGEVRPASTVFVVEAGATTGARTWGEVAPRARAVDPAEILDLAAAGEHLRRHNDPLDRAAGGYLSGLLRANIIEDVHLTGLLLRDRLGDAVAMKRIPRGTPLSSGGRPLDRWSELALEQLGLLGLAPLTALPGAEPVAVVVAPPAGVGGSLRWVWWTAGAVLVVGATGLGALFLVAWRRRRSGSLQVVGGGGAGEAMIPHLAREWRDRLVRALFTQRSVLLENEQAASRRVQEMEERLARLQPAIAEKIRGYEQRIEALEKEIAERDAETRELIRAKLVLARKELEAEITRNRIDWN